MKISVHVTSDHTLPENPRLFTHPSHISTPFEGQNIISACFQKFGEGQKAFAFGNDQKAIAFNKGQKDLSTISHPNDPLKQSQLTTQKPLFTPSFTQNKKDLFRLTK